MVSRETIGIWGVTMPVHCRIFSIVRQIQKHPPIGWLRVSNRPKGFACERTDAVLDTD